LQCTFAQQGNLLPLKKEQTKIALFGNPWYRFGSGSGGVQTPYAAGAINAAKRCDLPECNPSTAYLAQILVNAGHDVHVGSDGAQAGTGDKKFNATKAAAEAAAADVAVVVVYAAPLVHCLARLHRLPFLSWVVHTGHDAGS
jgi:hypothetical protein